MLSCVLVQRFIQSASFCSGDRASARISDLSKSKNTSSSGRSELSWASDFLAKISSSVSGAGAGARVGGGGGDGGGGGAGAAGGGGGGGEAATCGTILCQPASA